MVTITKKPGQLSPVRRLCFQITFFAALGGLFYMIVQTFDFLRDPLAPNQTTRHIVSPDRKQDPQYQRVFEEEGATSSSSAGAAEEVGAKEANKEDSNPSSTTTRLKKSSSSSASSSQQSALLSSTNSCPYRSLQDLSPEERIPKASGRRHIVDPPLDTTVTLVCCQTTQGPWSIAVHESWAPLGAQRFLNMVTSGYFNHTVPLMRCVSKFLCQFGLAGEYSKFFKDSLPDDPQWLPAGPDHRVNAVGVKRFQRGYFSYAGGGVHSRDNQLFVALYDNGPLGGGSPWEVPWGELVGEHSYQTLDKIYTGYGEDGPSQHLLWQKGALDVVKQQFPQLDWINSCAVVDEVKQAEQ